MTLVEHHDPGTVCWADVTSPDPDAAAAFYGALFGWAASPPAAEAGGYRIFALGDRPAAGLSPIHDPTGRPQWTVYVATIDVDAVAGAAVAAGGHVPFAPMDVLDAGRMALMIDPTGATIAAWQPWMHPGFGRSDEPGTVVWAELLTRDPTTAAGFYAAVLGWTTEAMPIAGTSYTIWKLGARQVGGMLEMDADFPPEAPPRWIPYICVVDADATVAQAAAAGATVYVPPTTAEPGTFALLGDPWGAIFAIIAPVTATDARPAEAAAAPTIDAPEPLAAALAASPGAAAAYAKLPPSHRARYATWVTEAKKAETRERRAAKAIELLLAGKARPT